MGLLIRLFVTGLLNGNPIAWGIMLVIAIPATAGVFHEGLTKRDPAAIGLMALLIVMALILIVVAIVDRKLNPKPKKRRKKADANARPAEYIARPGARAKRPQ